MNTKELKITPPEGYEIDRENSTLDHIKFKPIKKQLTYDDIAKELFEDKETFWIGIHSRIVSDKNGVKESYTDADNCASEKQAQKLLAINQLMNVAKYLNGDWKYKKDSDNWYIGVDSYDNSLYIDRATHCIFNICYFKSKELAEQAIEILGEDIIRLTLSTDW